MIRSINSEHTGSKKSAKEKTSSMRWAMQNHCSSHQNLIIYFKNIMKKCKKILFVVATHGDERVGLDVVEMLKKIGYDKYFDYLVANQKALEKNQRFIDVDLNRSYPGKRYSKFYEKRMAFYNLNIVKQYEYVIDFHEASMGNENFIIIPREKIIKNFPLQYINLEKILLWPNPKGPMSQVFSGAIELEFGMKKKQRKVIVKKAFNIAKKFIESIVSEKSPNCYSKKKKIYYVYGKLLKEEFLGNINTLVDFIKVKINNEVFMPLLTGQYTKEGIVCYKMKKI